MFSRNKSEPNQQNNSTSVRPSVPSIISIDLVVKGDLISNGEIQVDGTVNGNIKTATLLVGESAKINGEIKVETIRVHGRVSGPVTAKSVTLAKTAHVSGDVIHEDLSIEKGAFLEGHCKRIVVEQKVEATTDKRSGGTMASGDSSRSVQPDDVAAAKKMEKPSNGTGKSASV